MLFQELLFLYNYYRYINKLNYLNLKIIETNKSFNMKMISTEGRVISSKDNQQSINSILLLYII